MCITNNLQRHIRNLTNDGEAVARFLYDTMEGKHPDAKYHHKLEAAKLLERYNPSDDDPFVLSLSKGLPSARSGDESASTPEELTAHPSRHSRGNGNPVEQGVGTENTNPFVLRPVLSSSKSLPPARSGDESASIPEELAATPTRTIRGACPCGGREQEPRRAGQGHSELKTQNC